MASTLEIARELVSLPTVPLAEHLPLDHVRAFAAARPALAHRRDAVGNAVVAYGGNEPDLVLVAHLDHPGFAVEVVEGRSARLRFRGGVAVGHAEVATAVQFFRSGEVEPVGAGRLTAVEDDGRRLTGGVARVTAGEAAPGGFAMWRLPPWRVGAGRITARVCDDLMGGAAVLAVLDHLDRTQPPGVCVWGLFTRAEELGFLGVMEAVRLRTIPRSVVVLSLECSKALPHARQGDGVIVRVGDARSIFDPGVTEGLVGAAAELAGGGGRFRFQRRLMDGGACEATALCAAGYRAGGLALPLAGYHNMADEGTGIVAESVLLADLEAEVDLLMALVTEPARLATSRKARGRPAWFADLAATARTTLAGAPLGGGGPDPSHYRAGDAGW